jgi:hypothetical protein
MKTLLKIVAILTLVIIIAAGAFFLVIVNPGGDGKLASLQLPDGTQYVVAQRCNWNLEPYTVSFYMKDSNGKWGWCYIDHQASRWHDVDIKYNEASDSVVVTKRGIWQAALDRKNDRFSIGDGHASRDVPAPQSAIQFPEFVSNK